MGWLYSSFASGSEESLDAVMPEALDHSYSVALHYSGVKRLPINRVMEPLEPAAQGDEDFAVTGVAN